MSVFRVLSLGWGVQSWTIASMAALGEIPPIVAAVNADTRHERAATYAFEDEHTAWLEAHNVRVVTVQAESTPPINRWRGMLLPAYTTDGVTNGVVKRQCTGDWKIAPIRRWLQANREKQSVTLLMGISLDEVQRMRDSDVKYIMNEYPLVDKRMTRADCKIWLAKHGLDVPSKSSCVFCPFQSRTSWKELASANGADWWHAVDVDRQIRSARPPNLLYVHPAMRPLDEIDLRTDTEKGQLSLWSNECLGYCNT